MKKFFAFFAVAGILSLGMVHSARAQDADISKGFEQAEEYEVMDKDTVETAGQRGVSGVLTSGWKEGDSGLMSLVGIVFVLGLACCVERILSLGLADIDIRKLMEKVASALEKGDVEGATNLCHNTRGPVAAVCYHGLSRIDEDSDVVERMVVSYREVQSGNLKKRCLWIRMFIVTTLALGVLGTVIGMAMAFDSLCYAGGFSVSDMAGNIRTALFPMIFALVAAIVLYVFYIYIQNRIATMENRMKEASLTFLDLVMKYNWKYKR